MSKSVWHVQCKKLSDRAPTPRMMNFNELLVAEDLEEAIKIVRSKHPTCIILGISHRGQLTILEEWQVCAKIK